MGEAPDTFQTLHRMWLKSLIVLFGLCLCTVKCFNLAEEMVSNPNVEENFQNSASNYNSETAEQERQFELETYRKYILQLSEALKSCYDQNTVSSHPLSIVLSKNAQKTKRSPACMRKCVTGGHLHPAQCHSLC